MPKDIYFGTAGIPAALKGVPTFEALQKMPSLGLDALELEFVRQVNIDKETAKKIAEFSRKNDFRITAHASYYINLNSKDKQKLNASIKRLLNCAEIADLSNAKSIAVHAAYYMEEPPETVFENVKKTLRVFGEKYKNKKLKIKIGLETTGKKSQFGTLNEILRMMKNFKFVSVVVDFAHIHARCNGCLKRKEDFSKILKQIKEHDRNLLRDLHMHVSGITYGDKGEKHHNPLLESDFNYKALMQALKEFGVRGTLISESPILEEDALRMKRYYYSLK